MNVTTHQTGLAILKLMRFDKPVGIWLLLWPTWQSAWLISQGTPNLTVLALLTAGVIVMRATGCVINDLCDHQFDAAVTRTANRPLVSGAVSMNTARVIACCGLTLALMIALQLPMLCWVLAGFGAILTWLYPMSKRWFVCPQLCLGLAFAWPVLMTTAALTEHLTSVPWLLFVCSMLWPIAYDTLYAMADKDDDQWLPLHSSAKLLGGHDWAGVLICYGAWAICWLCLAWQQHSWIIALGLLLALYGLKPYLCAAKTRASAACFSAFQFNQWIGGIMWAAIMLSVIISF